MRRGLAYWRYEEERLVRELQAKQWDRKRFYGKCEEVSEVIAAVSPHHSPDSYSGECTVVTPPYIITRLFLQGEAFLSSPRSANVFRGKVGWSCVLITRSGHQSYYQRETFTSRGEALRRARDFINDVGTKEE